MHTDLDEQYDKIYRYCYMKLRHQQTAEDITQETFLRFLENKTYKDMGKEISYLYRIARNLCIDQIRKQSAFRRTFRLYGKYSGEDGSTYGSEKSHKKSGRSGAGACLSAVCKRAFRWKNSRDTGDFQICSVQKGQRMSEKAEKGNGGIRLKQKLKKELQMLYQPPDPVRKQEFLQRMPESRMSNMEFLRSQTGYIRKWNWLISAAVLTGGICAAFDKNRMYTGILAAMLPVLALSFVAEGSRSVRYGMEELEMVSRFSLKAVLMAKFMILGLGNMIVLAALFPLLMWNGTYEFLSAALVILFPYLLSCYCNLTIVRKVRGKESIYYCSAVSVLICGAVLVVTYSKINIYSLMKPLGWVLSLVILAMLTFREWKMILLQSEEWAWSF